MKTPVFALALCTVLASTLTQQSHGQMLTNESLSSDRIAIYHQFFTSDPALIDATANSSLNVSSVTLPFVYKHFVDPDRSCLSSAHIFDIATPHLHKLPAEAFVSDRVNLVDLYTPLPSHNARIKTPVLFQNTAFGAAPVERPDSLIALSEIVFDLNHTHAAFRYTYATGPDNGSGATVVYELTNGTWNPAPASCTEWTR